MPSASAVKIDKQASSEANDPIKQALVIVEHKIRNLEKRKRKIESYKEEEQSGKVLNADQQNAVSKFSEVLITLEFAKELSKQFQSISVEYVRQQKKQARKELQERAQQDMLRVKDILIIQDILQNIGQQEIREDFLMGQNGAIKLTEEELKMLDDLYIEVSPKRTNSSVTFEEKSQQCAEVLIGIVEGKPKEIVGTTYAKLKEFVFSIHNCGYFDKVADFGQAIPDNDMEGASEVSTEASKSVKFLPDNESQQVPLPPTSASSYTQAVPETVPSTSAVPVNQPENISTVEATYYTAAPAAYAPSIPRPLHEVISSVTGKFNFLQESELDSPDIAIVTNQPLIIQNPAQTGSPALPIPSQTFTNQNFPNSGTVAQTQAPYVPQTEIPKFTASTGNPPQMIVQPQTHNTGTTFIAPNQAQIIPQQDLQVIETLRVEEHVPAPEQKSDGWGNNIVDSPKTWGDSQQNTYDGWEEGDNWNQSTSDNNQGDSGFIVQTSSRGNYRGNRGYRGRGSSNGYRGSGTYQSNRGSGSSGYRNDGSSSGNYYNNGYQQRDNFGNNFNNPGYKRGQSRGNSRGNSDRGGRASGNRGSNANPRGGRYQRGNIK